MTPNNRRVSLPEAPPRKSAASLPGPGPGRSARILAGLRTFAGVALVAATSVGVAWVARRHVMTSSRFAITAVEVTGNDQRSSDAIVAESGLEVGANVFVADLDAAQAKLVGDPWIAQATLARRLPGTIAVHVTERKAAALAALGDTFLTTAEGEPFKKLEPTDPIDALADLPLVTGLRAESMADDRDGTMRTIRRAIDLAAEFQRSPLARRGPLEEVHVEADGVFSLVVGKNAVELVLGAPPFRRKLEQAARVVAELDKRGAKADAIMLDNDTRPDRVVVRMR
ncbi:MAG TPA: FtsQ-type POTRA domain-containing protein [Polyangiaceae bacterium]|jgi:cell division protein FtsQ|nr:FtsQ-type POTRA domain-containing protein [Polyangiaceae bacterium]